jgi:hypothetical protein
MATPERISPQIKDVAIIPQLWATATRGILPGAVSSRLEEEVLIMSRGKNLSALGLSLLLSLSGASVAAAAGLVFTEDFEGGALGNFTASGNSPVLTSSPVRSGRRAMKTTLNRLGSPISFRTEVTTGIGPANAQFFSDTWYGLSVFLPSNYVTSPVWEIVFQWHAVSDTDVVGGRNPPLSMHTENGKWMLSSVGDSRKQVNKANYESKDKFVFGSYAGDLNRWTDWVFRIRWDYRKVGAGNKGVLQAWKNGVLVVNQAPFQIGFNDRVGPYFKMGLYKGWRDRVTPVDTVSQRVLYHDEFRQAGAGGSYDEVAPRQAKGVAKKPAAPSSVEVQ